jgi:hypothetical protein
LKRRYRLSHHIYFKERKPAAENRHLNVKGRARTMTFIGYTTAKKGKNCQLK